MAGETCAGMAGETCAGMAGETCAGMAGETCAGMTGVGGGHGWGANLPLTSDKWTECDNKLQAKLKVKLHVVCP